MFSLFRLLLITTRIICAHFSFFMRHLLQFLLNFLFDLRWFIINFSKCLIGLCFIIFSKRQGWELIIWKDFIWKTLRQIGTFLWNFFVLLFVSWLQCLGKLLKFCLLFFLFFWNYLRFLLYFLKEPTFIVFFRWFLFFFNLLYFIFSIVLIFLFLFIFLFGWIETFLGFVIFIILFTNNKDHWLLWFRFLTLWKWSFLLFIFLFIFFLGWILNVFFWRMFLLCFYGIDNFLLYFFMSLNSPFFIFFSFFPIF